MSNLHLPVAHLFLKLNVDQVRLGAIRLPVCVITIITQKFNAIARFCASDTPHCKLSNISASLVDCKLTLVANSFCIMTQDQNRAWTSVVGVLPEASPD